MRVVIGTGGTAGHIFPALVLAAHLRESEGADVRFVGRSMGQEAAMVPTAGFPLDGIDALPFQRSVSLRTLRAPVAAIRAAHQARPLVRSADVVVTMGGYVSVPVTLAARRERVSLVLHEQNAIPGLANRVASRWATAVAVGFADATRHLPRRARTVVTGNPIRPSILRATAERDALAEEGRALLGLENGRRTVLVFGGSQGALRLNRAAVDAANLLRDRADVQLLVLTGARDHDEVRHRLPTGGALLVRATQFLERMEMAYALADLAVTRAGAMTIGELTACGVPSVLVPYPYATARHQDANARAVEAAGGAVVVLDDQLDGPAMAGQVTTLLGSADRLRAMARGARAFGRPDATEALGSVVVGAARGDRR
jgi:UDP-N-acetylglucosamine--N-acetylmuramyl-(pentapeptide) pyrophosphoryl-undecaprenol N-acetylglucosamine transferase